jgi:CheY-like chemotaxis protein
MPLDGTLRRHQHFYGEPTLIVAPNQFVLLGTRADIEAFFDRFAASLKRSGYRRLLEKHEGIVVVAEAADAAGAYQAYKSKNPDVVVMDVSLPGRGGIDAIRQIRQ